MAASDFTTEAQIDAFEDAVLAALNAATARILALETADFAPKSEVAFINAHGAVAGAARNDDYAINLWIGSVQPTNATANDVVVRTDETV